MFFVLNTGRAGSKTIAKVLSQSPDCECLHEPEPRLIAEAPRFRYGSIDEHALVRTLQRTRCSPQPSVAYGETNNKLALIVPLLDRAFPESRFLWLVRDGRDVVASTYQRGWFGAHEYGVDADVWQRWRLQGDLVGDVAPEEWADWDPFERCCWLWDYTNRLIRDDLEAVGRERWRVVRLEELTDRVDELCDFLGTTPIQFVIDRANRRTTSREAAEQRANHVPSVSTWQDWSPGQRVVFARRCGDAMDEVYPDWRAGDQWRETRQEVNSTAVVAAGAADGFDVISDEVAALRVERAELKLVRGDLRAMSRERRYTEALLQRQLKRANEEAIAARDELATAIEQHLVDVKTAVREANKLASRVRALERSTSYRLGHALVLLAKRPTDALRWLVPAAARRVSRVLPDGVRRRLIDVVGPRLLGATNPHGVRSASPAELPSDDRHA